MRRLAGSRLGATSTLSVVLALGVTAGIPAATQATAPLHATGAAAPSVDRPTTVDAELRAVSGARARAAAAVELPRPVRGANAVRLLGDQLDEAAALNDLSAADLTELLTTDPSAWVDRDGAVFYKDEVALAPANDPVSAQAPLDQTFLLHSKPGSTRTIYLDFDGGTASGTAWHVNYPATPVTQPAWDLGGNAAVFDDAERTAIQTVWQAVSEDYAPFDVDVTTADPGPAGIFRASAADSAYGSHVLITPSNAAHDAICGGCGGVAYISVFDTVNGNNGGAAGDGYGYMQPAWVFPQKLGNSPKNIAEAVSHEVGHNVGLQHDGNATQGYDTGHGAWAPIMGVGYDRAISQWSKGDYAGANNQQDDVAIIRGVTGSRTDEAPTGIAGAATAPAGTAYVTSRTDVDTFLLGTCSGPSTVTATTLASLADLDLTLSILDATGQVVATDDPVSAQTDVSTATGLGAALTRTLTTGTYYASVDGVGNGAWSTGYDDYGSLGAYTLTATGCDGTAPTGTPSAPTAAVATPHASDPTATVTWAAPTTAGGSAVTGYLLTRSGDDSQVQVGPGTTSYTWAGLASSTSYTFSVTALNAQGPGPSVTVSATTAAGTVKPGLPQSVTGSWDSLSQRAFLFYAAPANAGSYPVTGYDIYIDGSYLGRTAGTGVGISPVAPGTHTLGVAAVSQAGTGTLATVSVVVPARAPNDAFAQRATLSGVSGSTTGDNLESSAENGEPAPPALRTGAGAASVWYSWTAPGSGPATLVTDSTTSGRDTTLAVYTGTSVGTLTQVAGNDDLSGTSRLSSVQFTATAGTTYAVAVNGYRSLAAGVGQFSLAWTGTTPVASATTTTLGSVVTGRSAALTATVTATSGTPAGTVELRDGGVLLSTQPLASGSASVTLADLVKGDHVLRASFVPTNSALFTASDSAVVTSTIAATSSTTTLQATGGVQTVGLSAGVTVAAGTATGTVTFLEGSTTVGSTVVSGGTAAVSLTGVSAGQHTYTAAFVPADTQRYDGSTSPTRSASVTDPVVAKATTTTLTATPTGRSVALAATVTAASGTPQGTVQLLDGGTVVGTVTLSGGSASLQVDDLLRGTHRFTAQFVPSDAAAFVASQSAESAVDISATPTTTTLVPSVTGRSVSLQATVSPAVAGTVRFLEGATLLGTVTVSNGVAALPLSDVPAGSHTYTAAFVPADDQRHAPSTSSPQTADVAATPTATSLGSAVSDHRVTLTATVTSGAGSPTGSVEFREGSTVVATGAVSAGTATAVLDGVATGSHAYTATFVPTSPTSYAGSVSAVHTSTVVATPTTTGLIATASGRTVTLTATPATASGTLAGSVVFRDGSTVVGTVPLGAGPTVLELTSVAPGGHSYTASFVPTGPTHAGSTSPARSVTVQVGSTTALTVSASGRDVSLAVQVTTDGGTPAGVVELRDGSTVVGTRTLVAGGASLTLSGVAPGDHSYQATFVPTDTAAYVGSASTTRSVTVARVATTTDLTVSASGRTVTLTSTTSSGSGTPAGAVELREGTTLLGAVALSAGSAVVAVDGVDPGDHTYTATYVPTGTFHAGSASAARTVRVSMVGTSTALDAAVSGRTVTLTATPSASSGTLAGSVELREGGQLLGTVPLSAGRAVLTLSDVDPGSHDYRATYVPTGTAHTGSTSPVATAIVGLIPTTSDLTVQVQGRTVVLTSAVSAPDGTPAGIVSFYDGDLAVGTANVVTGSAGLTLAGVATGPHAYRAVFTPTRTDRYLAAQSAIKAQSVARSTTATELTATVDGDTVSFDVRVTSPDGQPDGVVTITEGGTAATASVVTAGRATFDLAAVANGSHSYVATFAWTGTGDQFGPSASQPQTVQVAVVATAAATTTGLTADVVRRTVALRAAVSAASGAPAGSVQFRQDGVLVDTVALVGGVATATRSAVAAGQREFTATYVPADSAAYEPSTSPVRAVAVQRTVTTTGLTGVVSGTTLALDVAVTGTDGIVPTGQVRVLAGGTEVGTVQLSGGRGTLVLPAVEAGTRSYRAVFDAAPDLEGSSSTPVELTVAAPVVTPPPPVDPTPTPTPTPTPATPAPSVAASTTKVTAPTKAKVGTRPVVTVTVARGSTAATGTVVVTVAKTSKTLTLTGGRAKLKLARLKAGKVRITVRYLGNTTTTASTASWTIRVAG